MMLDALFDRGELPVTLEDKTALCPKLLRYAKRIVPATALLVAGCRRDHFASNKAGWIAWARQTIGLEGSELHHRRAIGELLLDVRPLSGKAFDILFAADSRKLLPICQLEVAQVPAFLSHYPIQRMTRQEVRDAVRDYLGETAAVPVRPQQPALPGFETSLDTLTSLDIDDYRSAVTSPEVAAKSLTAAMGLLGASLEYHKTVAEPDIETLLAAKAALQAELDELDETIDRVTCHTAD